MTMLIPPPNGGGPLPVIFYLALLLFGPTVLYYLWIFYPGRRKLYDSYWRLGVECRGVVTHHKIVRRRNSTTGRKSAEEHKIRYAYRVPHIEENEVVFIKGYVAVKGPHDCPTVGQSIRVVVLPEQPTSAVPWLLLPQNGSGSTKTSTLLRLMYWLLTSGVTVYLVYAVGYLLYSFLKERGANCNYDDNEEEEEQSRESCHLSSGPYVVALLLTLAVGSFGAWWLHYTSKKKGASQLGGSVWKTTSTTCPEGGLSSQVSDAIKTLECVSGDDSYSLEEESQCAGVAQPPLVTEKLQQGNRSSEDEIRGANVV